jgi:hypothetical protein
MAELTERAVVRARSPGADVLVDDDLDQLGVGRALVQPAAGPQVVDQPVDDGRDGEVVAVLEHARRSASSAKQ